MRSALTSAYNAQRPLGDFFGGFGVPRSWAAFELRVDTNVRRYAANYGACSALIFLWTLLRTPRLLLCLLFTALAWALLAFGRRPPAPRLGAPPPRGGAADSAAVHAGVALAAGLTLTVVLGGVRAVAWAAFVSFCASAVHVALRARGKGRSGESVTGEAETPPASPAGAAAAGAGGAAAGFGSGGAVLRARGAPPPAQPAVFATPAFHRIAPMSGAPPAASIIGTPLPDAATLPRPR